MGACLSSPPTSAGRRPPAFVVSDDNNPYATPPRKKQKLSSSLSSKSQQQLQPRRRRQPTLQPPPPQQPPPSQHLLFSVQEEGEDDHDEDEDDHDDEQDDKRSSWRHDRDDTQPLASSPWSSLDPNHATPSTVPLTPSPLGDHSSSDLLWSPPVLGSHPPHPTHNPKKDQEDAALRSGSWTTTPPHRSPSHQHHHNHNHHQYIALSPNDRHHENGEGGGRRCRRPSPRHAGVDTSQGAEQPRVVPTTTAKATPTQSTNNHRHHHSHHHHNPNQHPALSLPWQVPSVPSSSSSSSRLLLPPPPRNQGHPNAPSLPSSSSAAAASWSSSKPTSRALQARLQKKAQSIQQDDDDDDNAALSVSFFPPPQGHGSVRAAVSMEESTNGESSSWTTTTGSLSSHAAAAQQYSDFFLSLPQPPPRPVTQNEAVVEPTTTDDDRPPSRPARMSHSAPELEEEEEETSSSWNPSLIWAELNVDAYHRSSTSSTEQDPGSLHVLEDKRKHSHKKDAIWAVALSSSSLSSSLPTTHAPRPSSSSTSPCLYLAVGTSSGLLLVTQLLDPESIPALVSHLQPQPQSQHQPHNDRQRLGATGTLQRRRRIRSLDFSPSLSSSSSMPWNSRSRRSSASSSSGDCWLACGGDDGTCALIAVSSQEQDHNTTAVLLQVMVEIPRVDRIYAIRFSPYHNHHLVHDHHDNGNSMVGHLFLAIGGYDETVSILDVSSILSMKTAELPVLTEIPVEGLIAAMDWCPDRTMLALGGSDKLCTLVNTTSNLDPHSSSSAAAALEWQVWCEIRRPAAVTCLQWHPQGHLLAIGCATNHVGIWDRATLTIVQELSVSSSPFAATTSRMINHPKNHWTHPQKHRRNNHNGLGSSISHNGSSNGLRISDLCWSPGTGHYLVVCATSNGGGGGLHQPSLLLSSSLHSDTSATTATSIATLLETKTYSTIQELPVQTAGTIHSVVWGQPPNHTHNNPAWNNTTTTLVPPKYLVLGGSEGKALVLKAGVDVMMHHNHRRHTKNTAASVLSLSSSQSANSSSYFGDSYNGSSNHDAISLSATTNSFYSSSSSGQHHNGAGSRDWALHDNAFGDDFHHRHHPVSEDPENDVVDTRMDPQWEQQLQHHRHRQQGPVIQQREAPEWVAAEPSSNHSSNALAQTVAFSRGSKSRPSAFFAAASADEGCVTVRSTIRRSNDSQRQEEHLWDPLCQLDFLDPITCLAFSNGSRVLACASKYNNQVHIVDTAPTWMVSTVAIIPGVNDEEGGVQAMAFSKNNERLAVLCTDGGLRLLDPNQDYLLCRELFGPLPQDCESDDNFALDVTSAARGTCFDWSSKFLAVGHEDGTVCVYRAVDVLDDDATRKIEATIAVTQSTPVRSVAIGPGSRFLAVGGDDGILTILCRNKQEQQRHDAGRLESANENNKSSNGGGWVAVHRVSTIDFSIAQLKWSPSGRHVAVLGQGQELKVIDTVFWSEVAELRKFTTIGFGNLENMDDFDGFSPSHRQTMQPIASISFSQDGKWMAIALDHLSEGEIAEDENNTLIVSTITWDLMFTVPLLPHGPAAGGQDDSYSPADAFLLTAEDFSHI